MQQLGRVKDRAQELVTSFSKTYVKEFGANLVAHVRESGKQAEPAKFRLLREGNLESDPIVEGRVFVGPDLTTAVHWRMAKNYVVQETPLAVDAAGVAPAAPGGEAPPEVDESKEGEKKDTRVWLHESQSKVCMNAACGQAFAFMKGKTHCRSCGLLFCKACTGFPVNGQKCCEPCQKAHAAGGQPPLLEKPKVKNPQHNFYRYDVSIPDGSASSSSGAAPKGAEGKFLLQLKHRRETRKPMTIAFATRDERDQWQSKLQSACYWSPSPVTMDPVLRPTFLAAYEESRRAARLWGSWYIDGTESELIADMVYEVLDREIVGAELAKLNGMPRKMFKNAVVGAIEGAVNTAWTALHKGLGQVRAAIEPKVNEMIAPMVEAEDKFKAQLTDPVSAQVKKLLEPAQGKLQEAFGKHVPIFADSAEASLNTIARTLTEVQNSKSFRNSFYWARWRSTWRWSYANEPVTKMLYDKLYCDGGEAQRDVYWALAPAYTNLHYCAYLDLAPKVKGQADPHAVLAAAYPDLIQRAAHDVCVVLEDSVQESLHKVLSAPMLEKLMPVLEQLCAPLQAMIPEMLSGVLDPLRVCNEIVETIVEDAECQLVQALLEPTKAKLIAQGDALAAKGLVA